MSCLAFLAPERRPPAPVARSPMERQARAAGARFEDRDGWNVAVALRRPSERRRARAVGLADVSHLRKLGAPGRAGVGTRARRSSSAPRRARRRLVVPADPRPRARRRRPGVRPRTARAAPTRRTFDVTAAFAAMTIVGPLAREMFARFCALDLRPQSRRSPASGRARSPARRASSCARRDDALPAAVRLGARRVHVGPSSPTRPRTSAAARSASTRSRRARPRRPPDA